LVPSYFFLFFGFCEVVAVLAVAGAEAGADADGGSGQGKEKVPRTCVPGLEFAA
jgi:hypothetical protein